MRSKVIHWAHTSLLTCHPGTKRTVFVVQQRFWWCRSLAKGDVKEYIVACSVYTRSKASRQVRMGLLYSSHYRCHIQTLVTYFAGLRLHGPASVEEKSRVKGNTVVLTVVDRFSKMTHFIPLAKLPSAKETANVMIHHVFRIHGLPTDIASDRGPQFVSTFWKEFCQLLGANRQPLLQVTIRNRTARQSG
ncbi:hypothetical protein L3Q82_004917 [Scortum barcoo]|uniref:Uncharacterized protein n=1 Tax=Scortum barcoo TaxID=214431 RepID=A0ACB8VDL8_9TELE|nr:hypothetical protein L3Q82_004917 [Scortum barcoo]